MAARKVGNCRLIRELGRGGMGVVYEAVQEPLERRVAVKELPAEFARSKELAERFRREGLAYAQLEHQAIVSVHDLVEKGDALYLITEYVDGADLSKLLEKGGALPPDCVAIVGARLAEALDYVHFHKLLHRDVKPANVMLSRTGEVKLMDFGIAKDQTEKDLTRDGVLVGSPAFLAPELLKGERPDVRSDLWALGVTLYQLVVGEKPFVGKGPDELQAAIRKGRFVPVRERASHVPRRLALAIERCLEKRPRARWPSAGALAHELQTIEAKLAPRLHPQARLTALMAHRGFATEEEALTCVDAESLVATKAVDEEAALMARLRPRPWRWALGLLFALGAAGAAAAKWSLFWHLK